MAKKRLKRSVRLALIIIFLGIFSFAALWGWGEYDYRYGKVGLRNVTLKVYSDSTSISQVAEKLAQNGVIASATDFSKVSKERGVSSFKAGSYRFGVDESYRQLINKLRFGYQTPIRVTFNNIRSLDKLAGVLGRALMADSAEFMERLTFEADSIGAGYIARFVPNTYEFYWTAAPRDFCAKMDSEFNAFWSDEARISKARKLGFTPEEITIIASIVDEETNAESEMSDVAGVYINRLRIGMPLQADPTVKYAIGDFSIRRVLNKHLTYDSPYNTYKYAGLPPGPICAPSIAAIEGTLNYVNNKHKYLYFCANPAFNGTHIFATTLSQHNANARAYQRELNRRKIK